MVLLCMFFVNILHVLYLLFIDFSNFNSSSCSVFVHIHANIDKDVDWIQGNNNASLNELSLFFSTSFLFFQVLCNKSNKIKLRLFAFLIVYLMHFLNKQIKTSDHYEAIKSYTRYEFFPFNYIDTSKNIHTLISQLTINNYSISKSSHRRCSII